MENVAGDSGDRFQRYQMPRIVTKVEGKGNGIKTVFPNIYEVGLALKRDPAYITRYFGYEFGALSQYNERTKTGVVNGNHSWNDVHELLKNFIRTFVLCQNCHNPETDFGKTGGALTMHCLACGGVSHCPPGHRLTLSILKEIDMMKKASKKGKAREEKADKSPKEKEAHDDKKDEKKAKPKPKPAAKPAAAEEEEEEEEEDTAPSADDDDEHIDLSAVDVPDPEAFRPPPRPAPKSDAPCAPAPSPKPASPPVPKAAAPANPFEGLLGRTFEQGIDEAKVMRAAAVLKPLLTTQMAQLQLIIALGRLLAQRSLMGRAAQLVKLFYDADLLPEEALLLWGDHPEMMAPLGADPATDLALREACAPLLTWLRTADEEDESEEEEAGDGKAAGGGKSSTDAFIDAL